MQMKAADLTVRSLEPEKVFIAMWYLTNSKLETEKGNDYEENEKNEII